MTKSKKMLALVIALVVMLVAVSGTLIAVLVAGKIGRASCRERV